MVNTDEDPAGKEAKEFKKEELETLGKKKDEKTEKLDADEMTPVKFVAKDDYQVKEALNYLKSFELFKKMEARQLPVAAAAPPVPKTEAVAK